MVRICKDFYSQRLADIVLAHLETDEEVVEGLPHVDLVEPESVQRVVFHEALEPFIHLHHVVQIDTHHHFCHRWQSILISFLCLSPELCIFSHLFRPLASDITVGCVGFV